MATTLLDLPPELIASTFSYLDDGGFFAARASVRHLERASFSTFGKRFFRKKGYMITTDSLDVLQNVSSHKELRSYVQHVWFNPDCYTFGPMLFLDDHFDDWIKSTPKIATQTTPKPTERTTKLILHAWTTITISCDQIGF